MLFSSYQYPCVIWPREERKNVCERQKERKKNTVRRQHHRHPPHTCVSYSPPHVKRRQVWVGVGTSTDPSFPGSVSTCHPAQSWYRGCEGGGVAAVSCSSCVLHSSISRIFAGWCVVKGLEFWHKNEDIGSGNQLLVIRKNSMVFNWKYFQIG